MVCNILEHYNLGFNIFGQSEMFGRVVDLIPKTEIPDISKNPDNSYIRDIFSAMIRGRTSNNCGMNSLQYSRNLHVLK